MDKDTLRRIKYEIEHYEKGQRKTKQGFKKMIGIIKELCDNSNAPE